MESRINERKTILPEKIFLILAVIFIGTLTFLMPINKVPDESNHAKMAWEIIYEKNENSFNWYEDCNPEGENSIEYFNEIFKEKINLSHEKFKLNISLQSINHVPQLLGMLLGSLIYPSIGIIVMMGRIFNALVYIIGVFLAIKYSKFGKGPLLFISLLPIMVQQAASLSYDVVNYLAIVFFYTLLTYCCNENFIFKKKTILLFGILAIILYATKLNNVLLLGLLFPLIWSKLGKKGSSSKLYKTINRHAKVVIFILIFCMLVLVTLYLHDYGGIVNYLQVLVNSLFNNNLNGHLNTILTVGIFGYIGLFEIQAPLWLVFVDVAVLTISLLAPLKDNENITSKFLGWTSFLMFPIQVVAVVSGMYFKWTPKILGENALISVGAQGRYFTPFLLFITFFFDSQKDNLSLNIKTKTKYRWIAITLILNFLVIVYLILLTYYFKDIQNDYLIRLRLLMK